jgi:hypothetical protein
LQPSKIAKFVEPNFQMFETRDVIYTADEYGASNNDLTFQDIAATTFSTKFNKPHPSVTLALEAAAALLAAGGAPPTPAVGLKKLPVPAEEVETTDAPWKLVAVTSKMQFTCSLKDINVSGRADFKAIKTVISKLAPTRVVVLRGRDVDCQATAAYSRANDIQSFAPGNRESVEFIAEANRVRLQLPQGLVPPSMKVSV